MSGARIIKLGKWEEVQVCRECRFVTDDIFEMSYCTPCPHCGAERASDEPARWVVTEEWVPRRFLWPKRKVSGHWQLRRDYKEAFDA